MSAVLSMLWGPVITPILTAILLAIFRIMPNDKIQNVVGKFAYRLGSIVTLGMNRWHYTKPFWETIIEKWIIDFVDNIFVTFAKEFINGLRSDNPNHS